MSKKIKKFVFLIPTLIVMLLNCVCYGQVVFSASAIDYSEYFKPVDECPHTYDFTDVDSIYSTFECSRPYYFYCVKMHSYDYENYISGLSYSLVLYFFEFDSSIPENQSSCLLHYPAIVRYAYFEYDSSTGLYNDFRFISNSTVHFLYYSNTGTSDYKAYYDFDFSNFANSDYCDGDYYYFQYSNIPDFPLFYDYDAAASALNVEVVFTPQLSGEVDRSVTLDDGSTALKNSITMAVYNRSNFDVQYQMHIYRKNDYPESGGVAPGVYSVFTYYEKDWVYSHDLDSNADWWNKVEKQYKATHCHLVWSGRTDVVTFDFNQLPLSEGVDYTVVVSAVRNDYKYASEHYV